MYKTIDTTEVDEGSVGSDVLNGKFLVTGLLLNASTLSSKLWFG